MTTFSSEQLNFFKFSTVVLDEFPVGLRQVFVYMWDTLVAPTAGYQKWDDSPLVRNMFLSKEGGKTKYVPTSKSYMEWDCTALFEATLFAESFSMPDGKGGFATLNKLFVKPLFLPRGAFHHSVFSPTGNQAETFALSLNQLRLLRNSLCHQISTRKIDKVTFDHYIRLAKDAFAALGLSSKKIDDVGKLGEKDFPTDRVQQLEEELRREKFKQIEDNLDQIETEVKYVGSDVKDIKKVITDVATKVEEAGSDVKTAATDVKTKVEEVGSDVKTTVADVQTKMEEVGSDLKKAATDVKTKLEEVCSNVKRTVADVKTKVEEVGSDVQTAVTDVKKKVEEVGSDVQTAVTDVKTKVEEVGSDVQTAVRDVKKKVEEVGSDVQTAATDVKTKVEEVGSDMNRVITKVGSDIKSVVKTKVEDVVSDVEREVTEVKTMMEDVTSKVDDVLAMKTRISKGAYLPDSCIPDKIPNFVGRQEECKAIEDHLTDGITRLVNVWGPPGFGKTSVAIDVAHHLQDMKIPVYFVFVRGMESKEQLVSKLLSMFADDKQVPHISPNNWLFQCLQRIQKPFVLILDNADDLLLSDDANCKQDVFLFIKEILAQCKHIKLFLTTRESLDVLRHTFPIHLEKVDTLDDVFSATLVRLLLPNVSEDDCSYIVKKCGKVPLSMRLMCSIVKEENLTTKELSEELKNSTLVEVLDNESFPDVFRLKILINTSFQRLNVRERKAFVSLCVFPDWFRVEEVTAVLDSKSNLTTKKTMRSLERKSLIHSSHNFSQFSIHSLLRSFIDKEGRCDETVEAVFQHALLQFYHYYISGFDVANENFLTGHSTRACFYFFDRRENILLSLVNGACEDKVYSKIVEVLSKAEFFLCSVLADGELFNKLYDTAVKEAEKKHNMVDGRRLLVAKFFQYCGLFFSNPTWDHSIYRCSTDEADWPVKLLCYYGIYQLLRGQLNESLLSLKRSLDHLSCCTDEEVLKGLVYYALGECLREKGDDMASEYLDRYQNWYNTRSSARSIRQSSEELPKMEEDKHWSSHEDSFFNYVMLFLTTTISIKRSPFFRIQHPIFNKLVDCTLSGTTAVAKDLVLHDFVVGCEELSGFVQRMFQPFLKCLKDHFHTTDREVLKFLYGSLEKCMTQFLTALSSH